MAEFLLIHGSCHGAWCWRDVLPFLNTGPHRARAIDLPGHGADPTLPSEVTLDLYARAILDAITGPVILVGHSMAGYPITAAATLASHRIAKLVFLCAYVPVAGMSLADMRRAGPAQPLRPAIRPGPDPHSFTFDPDMAEALFYHDCPPGTLAYALPRLCPQPRAPQETAFTPSTHPDRHYIRCDDDRAIPPAYQAIMAAGFAPGHVTALPTSHSPFFAAPQVLAGRLIEIAG